MVNEWHSGAAVVRKDDPQDDDFAEVVTLKATGIDSAPSYQRRFDMQATVIYIGRAAHGVAETSIGWTIQRLELVDGLPTTEMWTTVGGGTWSTRAAATYS